MYKDWAAAAAAAVVQDGSSLWGQSSQWCQHRAGAIVLGNALPLIDLPLVDSLPESVGGPVSSEMLHRQSYTHIIISILHLIL